MTSVTSYLVTLNADINAEIEQYLNGHSAEQARIRELKSSAEQRLAQEASRDPRAVNNALTLAKLSAKPTGLLFTHDIPFIRNYKPGLNFSWSYSAQNAASTGTTSATFDMPSPGDFVHDICYHVVVKPPQIVYDPAVPVDKRPLVRWCDYPGERLLRSVGFSINSSDIDRYDYNSVVMHRNFRIRDDSRLAWNRCVGQQNPKRGRIAGTTSGGGLEVDVYDGPQTPSDTLQPLELFIPLRFWFCEDIGVALPMISLMNASSRQIRIEFATVNEMCGFVNRDPADTTPVTGASFNGSLTFDNSELILRSFVTSTDFASLVSNSFYLAPIRGHQQHIANGIARSGHIQLQTFKNPTEYLMVGVRPTVYSQHDAPAGNHLSNWHKFHYAPLATATLQNQKARVLVPVPLAVSINSTGVVTVDKTKATIAAGQLGYSESLAAAADTMSHPAIATGTKIVVGGVEYTVGVDVAAAATVANAATIDFGLGTGLASSGLVFVVQYQDTRVVYNKEICPLGTLGFQFSGQITHYPSWSSKFYTNYIPYRFSCTDSSPGTSSGDPGACYMPFAATPGDHKVSGYINLTRVNNPHIVYSVSNEVPADVSLDMVIVGNFINWFHCIRGSANLRFA